MEMGTAENKVVSVILSGVGGQGSILASRLLGAAAMRMGLDVRVSEVHGMSQRGGSVITYVRCGEKVYAPVTAEGEADYLISFEELEAARWLPLLKRGGTVITSSQHIEPAPCLTGLAAYPENLDAEFRKKGVKMIRVNALELAKNSGFSKAVNVVMVGAFAAVSEFSPEIFVKSLEECLPERFLEGNKKAFMLGYNSVREQ